MLGETGVICRKSRIIGTREVRSKFIEFISESNLECYATHPINNHSEWEAFTKESFLRDRNARKLTMTVSVEAQFGI